MMIKVYSTTQIPRAFSPAVASVLATIVGTWQLGPSLCLKPADNSSNVNEAYKECVQALFISISSCR